MGHASILPPRVQRVITLADLAALHTEHADAWAAPIEPVTITGPSGDVTVGDGPITLMGCVNLSRDSTYRESVAISPADAVRMGRIQAAQGAAIIDLGAESSNARAARVGADAQIRTLVPAVEGLAAEAIVSVETYEPSVVRACLAAGARILNMTGREHEDQMLELAAVHDAAVVMCFGEAANVREASNVPPDADPIPVLLDHFGARLDRARSLGVDKVVIDPGMGFHYGNLIDPLTRSRHQTRVLAQTFRLRPLGAPVCNVLPHTYDLFGDEFRKAEGFYAVFAALGGAHLLRIHEVPHLRVVLNALAELEVR
jgi:dihydropteroate synthase